MPASRWRVNGPTVLFLFKLSLVAIAAERALLFLFHRTRLDFELKQTIF
jgi:hypothetical protein